MTRFWVWLMRRPLAGIVAAATAFAVVAAPAAPAAPAARTAASGSTRPKPPPASTRASRGPAEAQALAAARRLGRRVEVVSLRSDTGQVFANPRGTLTLVESAQPVRVRRGGRWLAVDTTLRRRADGTVAPVATVADLLLSGGGNRPLVRLAHQGRELTFGWRGALPRPVLAGDTATYPGVLPGVDLEVRVTADGFSDLLVVKTPQAARNPALSRIRLALAAKGVTVRAAAGGLRAVDSAGATVFSAGAPSMWEATATQTTGRHATMRLDVGRGEVAVVPDRRLLTDPRTRYPVFIDPAVSVGLNRWGNVTLNAPDQRIVDDPYRREGAKAGKACDPGCYQYRSLFAFGLSPVHGRHVLRATFAASLYHSWSCSDTPVELWVTGGISDATTWNNSTGIWWQNLDTRSGHANYPTCGQLPMRMEFAGGLAGWVQQGANQRWPELTLGLKAPNEGDVNQWKRFSVDGSQPGTQAMTLSIEYNSYPDTPDQITVDGQPCATGESRPYVITTTPTLAARAKDPDAGQQLGVQFVGGRLGSAAAFWTSQDFIANGAFAVKNVPAGILADGATYFFQAQAGDYVDGQILDHSAFSAPCEFTVDATPPNPVKAITSTDYPLDPGDDRPHGVAGRTGRFTLTPPDVHPEDVAFYVVAQNPCGTPDDCALRVPAGADHSATVDITPKAGLNTLKVWTQDRAGNLGGGGSPPRYDFLVRSGATTAGDPAASWSMNEGTGKTASDGSGHGNAATLSVGAGWASPGHLGVGSALSLGAAIIQPGGGGGPGTAATAGPVASQDPDTGAPTTVRTDRSFTVAAWVRLNSTNLSAATAVAQDGSRASGFYLQYIAGRWSFSQVGADADNPVAYRAVSASVPQAGRWTHLVGVYDASSWDRELRLYVNGVPEGSAKVATPWNATGSLTIGRAKYNGAAVDYWQGTVDDVRVYDRVLLPGEAADLADATVLTGRWDLGDGTGTTAADTSGFTPTGDDGTLPAGASWADVNVDDARPSDGGLPELPTVVNLDGTGGIVTKRPALDTSQSFSVTTWVRLTQATWAAAVAQDGSSGSGFYLLYGQKWNRWAFQMNNVDADDPPVAVAMSTSVPELGRWTHLAGVYDADAHELRLYVNGKKEGAATLGATAWNATGPLTIGQGKWNGKVADRWPGDLASVRTYAGVLSDAQVKGLAGL